MDAFLWWSGLVAWGGFAFFGMFALSDLAIDWLIPSIWTKSEFLAFVEDRLKRRYGRR